MSYSDKDLIHLLRIQAKTLQTVCDIIDNAKEEIYNQRLFIARMYEQIKKVSEEEKEETSETKELPSNVLQFPDDL